jgi:hypothetical protein
MEGDSPSMVPEKFLKGTEEYGLQRCSQSDCAHRAWQHAGGRTAKMHWLLRKKNPLVQECESHLLHLRHEAVKCM